MSFTIKEHNTVIDLKDIVDATQENVFEAYIQEAVFDMYYLISDDNRHPSLSTLISSDSHDDLKIMLIEEEEHKYNFTYSKVSTSGPIVGFLGFYIDLASGYVLLNGQKETEYIPLFNMVSYIEGHFDLPKGSIELSAFKWALERYKLNDITIFEMFEVLIKGEETSRNSLSDYYIMNYFKKPKVEYTEEDLKTKTEKLLRHLRGVSKSVLSIADKLQKMFVRSTPMTQAGNRNLQQPKNPTDHLPLFRERVGDEFYNFSLGLSSYNDKMKKIRKHVEFEYPKQSYRMPSEKKNQYWRKNEDRIHQDSLLHSAMADREFFMARAHTNKRVKKSDILAMNFLDLVEETEEPYADIMDMSISGDLDDLKDLTKRLDIEDIIKGAKLTGIKRGLNDSTFSKSKFIPVKPKVPTFQVQNANRTEDTYMGHYDRTYSFISKYIERVTKKLDSY